MFKATFRGSILVLLLTLLSSHSGFAQIAPGVQQSAAQTATITGTITQSNGTPVSGADVRLIGPAMLTTKSDTHGTFDFTGVPYGTYTIVANAANLGTASRNNLVVKGDIAVTIQYVPQPAGGLKEIARVSTSSQGAQINVTPASIASITPSDYAFQGNTSWRELLGQIPGVVVGGNLCGGTTNATTIPGEPFQPIVLSINGALPYETSTMLDGMPLVNTSLGAGTTQAGGGVDLSFLPMTAFDTADVVRGPGADAPSIVNSIGGSFVLHAPGQVQKNSFEFSASNDAYGGIASNAKLELRIGKLSATVTYGINNSPGPFGNQSVIPAYAETPATINGNTFQGCHASPPYPPYPYPYNSCYSYAFNFSYAGLTAIQGVNDDLLYCCVPINTGWAQHNGAIALSYDLTPSITAQVFYAGSSSEMQEADAYFPVNFTPGPGYSGSIAPGSYNYISTEGEPELYGQAASLLEEKITAYLGRGVLRLAALQNNSFWHVLAGSIYPANGQYTVWGTGYYSANPTTPVNFNGTPATLTFSPVTDTEQGWVNNRDLLASYATQLGATSSVDISYVSSYYNEPYWYSELFDGTTFTGGRPSAVSETTNEIRLHAGTELSNKLSLDASWYLANGSYHVQNPNDVAAYTNQSFPYSGPRFDAVWRVSPDISVRAAAGGGYALPPLDYLVGANQVYNCGAYYLENKTNLNLTPEKSFGVDLGTDIRFHRDTVLSFDLYGTNLYGQFFSSTTLTGTYLGLPLYTSQYNNLSQSRMEGINVDIRHDVPKGIYWHGALGLTRAYVVNVPAGFYDNPCSGPNSVNTYIVPGINFTGQFQSTVPYANGSAQLGYRWSPEKYIDLSPTYYGKNNAYFEPAFVEFDAHAGYPLTKNVSLLAIFRNITGVHDQNYNYAFGTPSETAPTIAGPAYGLFGIPYGPRTVILTANFKY